MVTRYIAILATLAFLLLFHANVAHAGGVTTEYVCSTNCDAGDTVSTVASLQSGTLTGTGTEAVLVEKLTLQFSNNPSLMQTACQSPSAPSDCVNVIVPGDPPYPAGTLTAIFHDGVFAGFESVNLGGGVQVEIRPTNNFFGEGISLTHGLGGDVLIHYPCCGSLPIYVETSQVIDLEDSFSAAQHDYSGTSDDPINTFTGELFKQYSPDLNLGGPMPLTFNRYYASGLKASGVSGSLGANWLHNFEWSLSVQGNNATITSNKGRSITFSDNGGSWDLTGTMNIPFQFVESGADFVLYNPNIDRLYTFDSAGALIKIEDGKGNTHTLTYGSDLTMVSDGLGRTLTFTYSGGKLNTVSDGTRTVTFVYTGHDLTQVTDVLSNVTTYTYDAGGLMTSWTLPAGKTVTYSYNANDNLTQVTDWLGGISSVSYDGAGQLTSMTRPNLVTTVNTYDDDNRLIGIDEGTISSISLTRDAKGQITGAIRVVPLSATAGGVAASAHTYDGLGRLTDDGDRTYVWDLASRLTSITEGGATTSFTYAASGHRLSRTVSGITRGYVWNYALRLPSVSIERQMGSDFRYYVHTPKGELLYSIDAATNARRFHHFDEMGNTIFLTDDAGAVTDSYAYTPYGNLTNSMGGNDNFFTWQGREGVMDEGNGLYYMRARYYDAKIARFISRDQILLISPEEINPYQYATNNPLKYQDPWGLRTDKEYIAAVADIALHALAARGGFHGARIAGPIANVLVTGYVAKKTLDSVYDSTKDFGWKIDQAEQIEWIKITKGDYSYEDHYRFLGVFTYADCDYRSDEAVDRRNEIRRLLRLEALYKIGAQILDNDPVKEFYTGLDQQKIPNFLDAEPKHVARALELGFEGNEDWFTKSDFNKLKKSWW